MLWVIYEVYIFIMYVYPIKYKLTNLFYKLVSVVYHYQSSEFSFTSSLLARRLGSGYY